MNEPWKGLTERGQKAEPSTTDGTQEEQFEDWISIKEQWWMYFFFILFLITNT